jgi:hypothetical protein
MSRRRRTTTPPTRPNRPTERPPRGGVWRHRRFRLFWTGDTISAAGGALSAVAVPLLALQNLHASGTAVGLVRAAQTVPFLLLALPVGGLVDRVSRRGLLFTADAARVPLTAAVAATAAWGVLSVPGLVALVFAAGVFTVVYEVTYLSVVPQLIDGPGELPPANRAVETAHAGASLIGPGVGGVLVGAVTAPGVVVLDAISFAAGATLTALNRWPSHRLPPAAAGPATPGGLGAGWRWLRGDPYVRPMTTYLAVNNVAVQAFQTAVLLFVVRTLHLPPYAVGLAVAAAGGGFLAGAFLSPAAAARWGIGRVAAVAALAGVAGIAVVATAGGLAPVVAGAFVAGAGPGLFNLHSIAVRQARAPAGLLGRVNAVVKTVSYGATSAGALAGGAAAGAWGPRPVIASAAVLSAVAAARLLSSAVRRLDTLG